MSFKTIILFICSSILFVCFSCKQSSRKDTSILGDTLKNSYSSGFQILKTSQYTYVKVINPWQQAQNVSIIYCLGTEKPKQLKENEIFIKTPVNRVVCMSTTHIAYLDAMGKLNTVKGLSGTNFVNNKWIKDKIDKGEIPDVGYEQNLNFELIASLNPDLVFAYSVGAEISGVVAKLKTLNIPVVIVGEYLETEPLAKAEWIKFFSVFYDQMDFSTALFDSVAFKYKQVQELAQKASTKPLVMSGLPWNGTWYVSGGQTYMGKLIEHANGNYIWKNEPGRESRPIDYELVFQKSSNADIWLNLGSSSSIADIIRTDTRLKSFKAVKTGMLFNNNARSNASGGNDYWESGTMQPHILLMDLIHIFHPELLPDHQLVYYKKLN